MDYALPVSLGVVTTQTLDGADYPQVTMLSKFFTNYEGSSVKKIADRYQEQTFSPNPATSDFIENAGVTALGGVADTWVINVSLDSGDENDYTDPFKVGAMTMYCANWDFTTEADFTTENSNILAETIDKEYEKCITVDASYEKERIFNTFDYDASLTDFSSTTPTCTVLKKERVFIQKFCHLCPIDRYDLDRSLTFENYQMSYFPLNDYGYQQGTPTNNFQDLDVLETNVLGYFSLTRCGYITDTDFRIGIFAHTDNSGAAQQGNKQFRL